MSYNKLLRGYQAFRSQIYPGQAALLEDLAQQGQRPKVLMISCSDSRVDPSILLNTDPGDLFVLRNVANIVPPYTPDGSHHGSASAVEFAVRSLMVEHIVVMGHAGCGGCEALLDTGDDEESPTDFVHDWVRLAKDARARVLHDHGNRPRHEQLIRLEEENVRESLAALKTYPWLKARIDDGSLELHGWRFDVEHGSLWVLDEGKGTFEQMPVDD